MKDILVSLFLVSSVAAGASETAGVTNFMEGENPLGAAVRSFAPSGGPFASVAPVNPPSNGSVSSMYIAYTDGTGVRARSECSPDAAGSGAIAEGVSVQVLRIGGAECPGWALVSAGGAESWVRMTFLNAANPARPSANASNASNVSNAGKGAAGGQGAVKAQGVGATGNGHALPSSGGGIGSDNALNALNAPGAPTVLPSVGVTKGLSNGQGWGQGIGGGQDHLASGFPAPGNSGNAAAGGGNDNGQGWGQGVGGGQDHQSSGGVAPGGSGDSNAGGNPK